MFRPASQSLLRQSLPAIRRAPYRRFLSTAPPAQRSRSWRNSAVRWGLAVAGVYYYNTSTLFAEEPTFLPPQIPEETAPLPTISSLSPSSRRADSVLKDSPSPYTSLQVTTLDPTTPQGSSSATTPLSETEEEASQQGAFNEETGEINWDCPCLGGMAHGPCGPEFRAAFSCFVYSKEEPKGMDCIENFKGMQDCFRQHPDVYGSELDEDGEDEMGEAQDERIGANEGIEKQEGRIAVTGNGEGKEVGAGTTEKSVADKATAEKPAVESRESIVSESEQLVPKAAHDATDAVTGDPKK